MQWLILTEGLPVGAWRAKIGLSSDCQFCPTGTQETLQHAFHTCPEVTQAWDLFGNTQLAAGLQPTYLNWTDISRGLLREPPGPNAKDDLQWDTASAFSINSDTPWDILRAQLLWAIWCQKVAHAFRDDQFHLGAALWNAWRNTIYAAMEAYKELFRHKRNEEKRQELISCFQEIWTAAGIFGRRTGTGIKWNLTPHAAFLPHELGAWMVPPIRIHRLSPSPDVEAEFMARPEFPDLVNDFVNNIGNQWRPPDQAVAGEPSLIPPPAQDISNTNTDEQNEEETREGPEIRPETSHRNVEPTSQMTVNPSEHGNEARNEAPRLKPKSRPKSRCYRKHSNPNIQASPSVGSRNLTRSQLERNTQLAFTACGAHDKENRPPRTGAELQNSERPHRKCRPKVHCTFGPKCDQNAHAPRVQEDLQSLAQEEEMEAL